MNILLGDWSVTMPEHYPSPGDTFTREIAGRTVRTVVMPDGMEWTKSPSMWTGGLPTTDEANLGRCYTWAEAKSIETSTGGGWRLPSWEDVQALGGACGFVEWGSGFSDGGKLKSTDYWDSPNAGAENFSGFDLRGTGYFMHATDYRQAGKYGGFWTTHEEEWGTDYAWVAECAYDHPRLGNGVNTKTMLFPVRLLRSAVPIPGTHSEGKHDIILSGGGSGNMLLSGGLDQRIACALQTFQGEWWLDPSEGVPYFTDIFKKSPDLATVRQALATVIQRVPGVQRIDRLEVSLNRGTRVLSVDLQVTGTDKVAYYRVTEVAV